MALCDQSKHEVTFKIAYCGPRGSGKTANLQYIHKKLDPHFRGDLLFAGGADGGSMSECLPVKSAVFEGYSTQLKLFSVPTELESRPESQKLLQDVDGVVFVADSDPAQLEANVKALQSTRQALEINGQNPDEVPFVFQFNKSDLPGAIFPDELDDALAIRTPSFLGCAISGYQVFATLDHLSQIVLNNFHSSAVKGREQIDEEPVASSIKIALSR